MTDQHQPIRDNYRVAFFRLTVGMTKSDGFPEWTPTGAGIAAGLACLVRRFPFAALVAPASAIPAPAISAPAFASPAAPAISAPAFASLPAPALAVSVAAAACAEATAAAIAARLSRIATSNVA